MYWSTACSMWFVTERRWLGAELRTVTNATAIRTRGLSKDYGRGNGLFDLDLEVGCGEIFGFLGPNGAGKSTTMRLLLDLISPSAGSAQLLGLDSHRSSLEIRQRVGYLPGDFALYPKLTGAAMLDYLADLRGGVDRRLRDQLAERFDAQLDRPVHELSTATGRSSASSRRSCTSRAADPR